MRVSCLRTGVVREREGARGIRRYFWAGWREDALPVNAFLVEHEAGLCLFDAGQTAHAAEPGYFPWWQPFFRLARFELEEGDEVAAQLASEGVAAADVRWVVLSHLHTDHVGGLAPFRGAEVVVTRAEWERARGRRGRIRGYLPQYWPAEIEPRILDLDADPLGPFAGSFDLLGDGSLVVVATPGHTRGHAGLLVRDGATRVLLGGDAAHTEEDLRKDAPAIARYCLEEDVLFLAAHDWCAADVVRELEAATTH